MNDLKRPLVAGALACALAGCNFGGGAIATGVPGTARPDAGRAYADAPLIVASHHVAAFDISSALDPGTQLPAFVYKGQIGVAPTIEVDPGDTIDVNLHDGLPAGSDMSGDLNVHFHGLSVSPQKPSDDVLTMMATPGQTLHYVVHVPTTQPPGLYWYHPHVHGQTEYQVGQGGMSGAIVIRGIEKHYAPLANMPQYVFVVRAVGGGPGEAAAHKRRLSGVMPNAPCPPFYNGFLTLNGQFQPTIEFQPGKPAFFRIVNATGHRTLDLNAGGLPMLLVAIDGFPIDTYRGGPSVRTETHLILPPAARAEFVVTPSKATALSTRCYDSGPVGDADPAQLLANLTPNAAAGRVRGAPAQARFGAAPVTRSEAAALPAPSAHRVVDFSEDAAGFYINGQAFSPSAKPMFVVHTGTVERWTVNNLTREMHDFHLHQVHFLVESVNGVPIAHPTWSDTFVVPWETQSGGVRKPGTVEMIADFRSHLIRGTFLFHCHILDHEDQGMMAKIQAM